MSHNSFFFVAEYQVSQFYNKESHKNETGIFKPLTLPKLPKSMCNNGNYEYTDTDTRSLDLNASKATPRLMNRTLLT